MNNMEEEKDIFRFSKKGEGGEIVLNGTGNEILLGLVKMIEHGGDGMKYLFKTALEVSERGDVPNG